MGPRPGYWKLEGLGMAATSRKKRLAEAQCRREGLCSTSLMVAKNRTSLWWQVWVWSMQLEDVRLFWYSACRAPSSFAFPSPGTRIMFVHLGINWVVRRVHRKELTD
jgi:hypothetical protein